jgi:hypothetical protein
MVEQELVKPTTRAMVIIYLEFFICISGKISYKVEKSGKMVNFNAFF